MSKWIKLEEDGWIIVLPETDIKPHGFPKEGENTAELAGISCPCKPDVDMSGIKPIIVHNSFEDTTKVDESMNKLSEN